MKKTEFLKYTFTEAELKEKSTQLALECRNLEEVENEKKQVVADFKSKIEGHNATISRLSNHINSGYEYKNVECEVKMNTPKNGKKTTIRLDTNEKLRVEDMTQEEKQEKIFDEKE